MDSKSVLLAKSLGIGVLVALVLGVLFHLVGLNSHGWALFLLLAGAAAGIWFYRHNRPNATAVP